MQTEPHLLQHHAMPLGKLLSVTLGGIRETGHRALAEEEAEHAADVTSANLSSSHSLVNLCRLRLHVSACSHSQIRDSQGRTTWVFNASISLLSKSRPRTHLVAMLLGSIQNAVDEFAGDLVQVLIASWLLTGLASVRACE